MKQYNKPRKSRALFGLGFLEMIPSPRLGFLKGVFLANLLASTDSLTRTTKRENNNNNTIICKVHIVSIRAESEAPKTNDT